MDTEEVLPVEEPTEEAAPAAPEEEVATDDTEAEEEVAADEAETESSDEAVA
jgi:hypothetical protein